MKKEETLKEIKELRSELLNNLDKKEFNKTNLKIMCRMWEKGYQVEDFTKSGTLKRPTSQSALDYLEILKDVLKEI